MNYSEIVKQTAFQLGLDAIKEADKEKDKNKKARREERQATNKQSA